MEEKKVKKYQAATYGVRDMTDSEVRKMRKQSKIVMILIAFPIVAVIMLYIVMKGYLIYLDVPKPKQYKLLHYMEKKYGEKFGIVATDGKEQWESYYAELKVSSEKFPDEIITVVTYYGDKGKRIYQDNYIGILRRTEFDEAYQEVVNKIYDKSKVFMDSIYSIRCAARTLPANVEEDTPISDILCDPTVNTNIVIYLEGDIDKKEEQLEELRLELKKRKWNTSVDIYYMQKEKMKDLTSENYKDILYEYDSYYLHGYMVLSDDFTIKKLKWMDYSED